MSTLRWIVSFLLGLFLGIPAWLVWFSMFEAWKDKRAIARERRRSRP